VSSVLTSKKRRFRPGPVAFRHVRPFSAPDDPPLAGGWRDRRSIVSAIPDSRQAFESDLSERPAENTFHQQVLSIDVFDTVEVTMWLAAEALGDWDRPESPTDVHSRQQQLLRALVLVGRIGELLHNDRMWLTVTKRSRSAGGSLADAIVAFEWAVCAPGGLQAAARLCGSPVLFAVWCDETWWLTSNDLDPLYLSELAGRPVVGFVRAMLAAAADTLSRQGQTVGSPTSC
jgi:hypothetical protein